MLVLVLFLCAAGGRVGLPVGLLRRPTGLPSPARTASPIVTCLHGYFGRNRRMVAVAD